MEDRSPKQHLSEAVECLAKSAAPIQQRLFHARGALTPLFPQSFSDPDAREQFVAISETLFSAPVDESDRAAATVQLSDEESESIAQQIVDLDAVYRPLG